jgi:hypothetical protein
MSSVAVARTPSRGSHIDARPDGFVWTFQQMGNHRGAVLKASVGAILVLLLCQTGALFIQVFAVCMSRHQAASQETSTVVSTCSFALAYASALWMLTRPRLARAERNTAVVCIGLAMTLQWRLAYPLMFTDFDEQLHMRTLRDIDSAHRLFLAQPTLPISPRYPGLESLTALFHQLGLPVMAAAMAVVFLARLVLVLALCDAVEQLTGSPRAGGLAVAVYATSSQFVYFISAFAYQTLALPLALAAVAFIARARWVADPRPLLAGATVCLLAVAASHHLTSWITAGFLAVWAIAERGSPARRRVFYGAAVAVATATAWAAVQWSLLREYFGPMADEVGSQVSGGSRRKPFSDPAGFSTPLWERVFLVYYAVAITLVMLLLVLICARSILRRVRSGAPRCNSQRWEPRVLLVLMVVLIPLWIAARVVPSCGELADRSRGFLFLPLSLLVADGAVRWSRSAWHSRPRAPQHVMLVRSLATVLVTGVFVGGFVMGAGFEWMRLPGPYLASADSRSMDAETLAAVRWARDGLPGGSRIGAERVSRILLANEAGLWTVNDDDPKQLYVAPLYFSDDWGPPQSEVARRLYLRYLYVDRRWADDLPHFGGYFHRGEMPNLQQLTRAELTKFDNVPGIHAVYRHGPIVIYDLSGLGVPELRTGWWGEIPPLSVPIQLVTGSLLGLALTLVMSVFIKNARSFLSAAGPSLTLAASVGALCVTEVTMLLGHLWLGPAVFVAAALVVVLVNRHRAGYLLRTSVAKLHWRWITAFAMVAVAVAAAIALSVLDAYPVEVTKVQTILDDPTAVHISAEVVEPAGSGGQAGVA